MRRIISSVCLLAVVAATMNSCKKGEVVQDVNSLGQGSYVTIVQKNNLIVDATNPAGSKVGLVVKEYGASQEKVIVYTAKGTATQDRTKWKKVKEFPISNGEYTIEVTGAEIAAAVGTTLAPGDIYTMYNSCITTDGRVFDFGNTFAEYANNPIYNMALTWQATVVCPFIPADAAGTYTITTDPWDGAVGETSEVTSTANNTATLTYAFPYAAPPGVNPLVLTIVPATGGVTVAKQTYGSYGAGFENFTAAGTGFFFSCTGFIDLTLNHVSGGGTNYGTYALRMKK